MTWGILGALDQEVALIKEQMDLIETKKLYHSDLYIGSIAGQRVAVVCCSIGKVNAAACTAGMIREFGAQAIVNVGVAGAVGAGLNPLDIVVSDQVAFHDSSPELFSENYPYRNAFDADPELLSLCRRAIEGDAGRSYAYRVGKIATGDQFVSDKAVKEDIVRRLSPLCVEMEGAAIGQVAYLNQVPFLVIRSMSDSADDGARESFESLLDRAARHSAKIVVDMIRLWGK